MAHGSLASGAPDPPRSRLRCSLAAGLALCMLGGAGRGWGAEPRWSRPGDLSLRVRVLPEATVSAGEPVIAAVTVHNATQESLWLALGDSSAPAIRLTVRDEGHAVLAATPAPGVGLDATSPLYRLPPGGSYVAHAVVSGMLGFAAPGRYSLDAELRAWPSGESLVAAQSVDLQVVELSGERLEAACEAMFRPLRPPRIGCGDIPAPVRALALCSVRQEVALPYLEWLARERCYRRACLAMRRLHSAQADRVLAELRSRPDAVGRMAWQAMSLSLDAAPEDTWP